jgi:DNA invertase Pin-like site-specific DNA recombinase
MSNAVELGVSYLRVSSKSQLDTAADIDPDGNSISTQREYTQNKARSIGVVLQREFVEPGRSAQDIAKRPVFRELLTYLKQHPEIKYVFIYMRSRAFRNYLEAGLTERQFNEQGVKLISAKEDFGEGFIADGMKAITDVINWMEVRRNGADIKIKMANKVKNGGTVGLAKIGYTNARIDIGGRKVNTIALDEDRAPLVLKAFELFGTGLHTLDSLHELMVDLGLKTPGRDKPIARYTLHKMLRDRYYIGKVNLDGIEYQGRHQPIVSEELFDRVQRILDAHSGSGTRERQHPHYLKGLVWCGRCKHRYTIMPGRGNGGEYFYFMCRGRQMKQCDHPYVPVDVMEQAIEQHYAHAVILPADIRARVREAVQTAVDEQFSLTDEMREQFTRQLEKLDSKESYFLDLAAEEGWPKDKLRDKINSIRDERKKITRQLETATNQLETGRQVFLTALELLDDPHALYARGNETVKAILSRAFFTRLHVDGGRVTGQELAEPFNMLHEAYTIWREHQATRRTYYRQGAVSAATAELDAKAQAADEAAWQRVLQTASSADLPMETGATSGNNLTRLLALALADTGSSKRVMVGLTGFEPATP